MGKKKESFFERLVNKNSKQASQDVKTVKPKSKRWKIILTSSILILAISAGITVPLVINSTKKNYIQPLPGSDNLAKAKHGDVSLDIPIKDFEKNHQDKAQVDTEKKLEAINKQILFYLYDQEQKASENFQKIWNETKEAGTNDVTSFRLKTIDELAVNFKNELKDQERNIKNQFGSENWESEFNKYLFNQFSGAKTIDEAVQNKIYSSIKSDALRRFRLVSGDKKDVINRKKANGEWAYDWWHKPEVKNHFWWEVDGANLAVVTESYVDAWKSPEAFITKFLKDEKPSLISEFILPGVMPAKKGEKWTVDKSIIEGYLFFAKQNLFNNTEVKGVNDIVPKSFKPFKDYVKMLTDDNLTQTSGVYLQPKETVAYSQLLSLFSKSPSEIKTNWGTSGLTTISDLMSSNNFAIFLTMNPQIMFGSDLTKIKIIKYFEEIKKIRENVAKAAGIKDSDLNPTKDEDAIKFNNAIDKYFADTNEVDKKGLYQDKFNELIVSPLSKLFKNGTSEKVDLVYKINGIDNAYGFLTPQGFKLIFFDKSINTKESIFDMIKNDYRINTRFNKLSGVRYNVLSKINKEIPKEEYIDILLQDTDFIKYIKEKVNTADSEANKEVKYNDESINELKNITKRNLIYTRFDKFVSLTEGADKWLNDNSKSELFSGFVLQNNKIYFENNNNGMKETALDVVYKLMKDEYIGN